MDYLKMIKELEDDKALVFKIAELKAQKLDDAILKLKELQGLNSGYIPEPTEQDGSNHRESDSLNSAHNKERATIKWKKELPRRAKAKLLLSEIDRFSQIKEIAELARKHGEPEQVQETKRNLKERLSADLTALKNIDNSDIVFKKLIEAKNVIFGVWGYREWLDENGEIKPEKMYSDEVRKKLEELKQKS